jgi:alpha-amylase
MKRTNTSRSTSRSTSASSLGRSAAVAAAVGLTMSLGSCAQDGLGTLGQVRLETHVDDWRDEIIYQLLTDRFANGESVQRPPRRALGRSRATRAATGRGSSIGSTTSRSSGSRRSGSAPSCSTSTTDAGLRRLPRLLGRSTSSASTRTSATSRRCAPWCDECHTRAACQGDRRHRHQPPRAGLLLRHQQQRAVPTRTSDRRRCTSSPLTRITEYDPDYDPRGIQSFTSLGESGPRAGALLRHAGDLPRPAQPAALPGPERLQPARSRHGLQRPRAGPLRRLPGRPQGSQHRATSVVRDRAHARLRRTGSSRPTSTATASTPSSTSSTVLAGPSRRHPRQHLAAAGKTNFFMFGEAFDGDDALIGSYTLPGHARLGLLLPAEVPGLLATSSRTGGPTRKISRALRPARRELRHRAARGRRRRGAARRPRQLHR